MSLFWRIFKWLAAIWLLLVAVGFCSAAFAQALPATVFPQTVVGNVTTFTTGTANAANASSLTFGAAANGPLYATAQQSINLGGGRTATAAVKTFPDALTTAKAIGRFASKVSAPLVVGNALYDLGKELGFNLSLVGGALSITKTVINPEACTVAPCYNYNVATYTGTVIAYNLKSLAEAKAYWEKWVNDAQIAAGNPPKSFVWWEDPVGHWYACENGSCYRTGSVDRKNTRPPDASGSTEVPSSLSEFEPAVQNKIGNVPQGSALPRLLPQVIQAEPLPLPKPAEITGPSSVPLPPTVTNNPDGSTTTTTPRKDIAYGPDSVTVTDGSTTVTTDPLGNVTSTTTTTKPAEMPEIKTCGYPGGPPCKIDEAGTPEPSQETAYDQKATDYKADADEKREVIAGSADKGFLEGWATLFAAPPMAACEPMVLPTYRGVAMGQIDPCGTADGIRLVMGYLWALGGFWLCLGWIRECF